MPAGKKRELPQAFKANADRMKRGEIKPKRAKPAAKKGRNRKPIARGRKV